MVVEGINFERHELLDYARLGEGVAKIFESVCLQVIGNTIGESAVGAQLAKVLYNIRSAQVEVFNIKFLLSKLPPLVVKHARA